MHIPHFGVTFVFWYRNQASYKEEGWEYQNMHHLCCDPLWWKILNQNNCDIVKCDMISINIFVFRNTTYVQDKFLSIFSFLNLILNWTNSIVLPYSVKAVLTVSDELGILFDYTSEIRLFAPLAHCNDMLTFLNLRCFDKVYYVHNEQLSKLYFFIKYV